MRTAAEQMNKEVRCSSSCSGELGMIASNQVTHFAIDRAWADQRGRALPGWTGGRWTKCAMDQLGNEVCRAQERRKKVGEYFGVEERGFKRRWTQGTQGIVLGS